jgi:hypothetical protein
MPATPTYSDIDALKATALFLRRQAHDARMAYKAARRAREEEQARPPREDAWRAISTADMGLGDADIESLHRNGVETMGGIADLWEGNGSSLRQLSGVDDQAAYRISAAYMRTKNRFNDQCGHCGEPRFVFRATPASEDIKQAC